jgi:hypothetical protein
MKHKFNLRHLFFVTATLAICFALVRVKGPYLVMPYPDGWTTKIRHVTFIGQPILEYKTSRRADESRLPILWFITTENIIPIN